MTNTVMTLEAQPSLVRLTHIVYGLHALGLVIGAFGAASDQLAKQVLQWTLAQGKAQPIP